jgi:hypothetical protein
MDKIGQQRIYQKTCMLSNYHENIQTFDEKTENSRPEGMNDTREEFMGDGDGSTGKTDSCLRGQYGVFT